MSGCGTQVDKWLGLQGKVLRLKLHSAGTCTPELEMGFTAKAEENA